MLPVTDPRRRAPMTALLVGCLGAGCVTSSLTPPADLAPAAPDSSPPTDLIAPTDLPVRPPCDPYNQTFCPADAKCTVQLNARAMPAPTCAPLTGAARPGERCTRMDGQPGFDDCAAGFFCTSAGSFRAGPPYESYCRRFCRSDADCAGLSERCLLATSTVGYCAPVCSPFSSGCPAKMSCSRIVNLLDDTLALSCVESGAAKVGDPCNNQFDCPPDSICWLDGQPDARCLSFCDAMHPCASGQCMRDRGLLGWPYSTCQ